MKSLLVTFALVAALVSLTTTAAIPCTQIQAWTTGGCLFPFVAGSTWVEITNTNTQDDPEDHCSVTFNENEFYEVRVSDDACGGSGCTIAKMGIKGTRSIGDTFKIDAVNGTCIKLCVCSP